MAAQRVLFQRADIHAVHGDPAGTNFVKAGQQRTYGAFAAAGSSHQCHGSAGTEFQIYIVQYRHILFIGKGDIFILHAPGKLRHRLCIRGIDDLRSNAHYLIKTLESGIPPLKLFRKVQQHFQRPQKYSGIKGIYRQICRRQFTPGDQPAAAADDHDVEQTFKKGVAGVKQPQPGVTLFFGNQKGVVAGIKFGIFKLLIAERLHHPDAGKRIDHIGIDFSYLAPVFGENFAYPPVLHIGKYGHHRRHRQQQCRQFQVDKQQCRKCSQHLHPGHQQRFRSVMRHFGDIKKIVHQPGHQLSGIVAVIIGK